MASPLSISFSTPFHEAIKAAQQRGVVLPDVYYGELQGLARQMAFSIAGVTSLDQLTIVRDSLAAKTQSGITFNQWKKEILESGTLDLPDHRLDNIYRTNLQGNYNRGRWQSFETHKKLHPYLMYDAINDSRVRPTHLAMDGIIRPVGDKFWDAHGPGNGYRCRCRLIPLNERQAQARSGQDQGLNKAVDTEAMKPDPGWGYNPGHDPMAGINKAIAERKSSAPPVMIKSLESSLSDLNTANDGMMKAVEDVFKSEQANISADIAVDTASKKQLVSYLSKLKKLFQSWFIIEEIARVTEEINKNTKK